MDRNEGEARRGEGRSLGVLMMEPLLAENTLQSSIPETVCGVQSQVLRTTHAMWMVRERLASMFRGWFPIWSLRVEQFLFLRRWR
jgi:hypothetical protein